MYPSYLVDALMIESPIASVDGTLAGSMALHARRWQASFDILFCHDFEEALFTIKNETGG